MVAVALEKRQPCSCYVSEAAAGPPCTPAFALTNDLESTIPALCQSPMLPACLHMLLPPQTNKWLEKQETVSVPFTGIGWLPQSGRRCSSSGCVLLAPAHNRRAHLTSGATLHLHLLSALSLSLLSFFPQMKTKVLTCKSNTHSLKEKKSEMKKTVEERLKPFINSLNDEVICLVTELYPDFFSGCMEVFVYLFVFC